MTHLRKQIRDGLVTALTGLPQTGNQVFASRVYPMEAAKLPGIIIYTTSEEVETQTIGRPRTQFRQLAVAVEIYVKGGGAVDDVLDNIASTVEQKLAEDVTLGGICKDLMLTGMEARLVGDGEQPAGIGILSYVAIYATKENNPTQPH
jgi:hypothetical protein